MKKIFAIITLVCLIILTSFEGNGQDTAKIKTAGADITVKLYFAIMSHILDEISTTHCFVKYTQKWWACVYRDGFTTYNHFRSHRTIGDVYNYFVLGQGDCDAIFGKHNKRTCYLNGSQARDYTTHKSTVPFRIFNIRMVMGVTGQFISINF